MRHGDGGEGDGRERGLRTGRERGSPQPIYARPRLPSANQAKTKPDSHLDDHAATLAFLRLHALLRVAARRRRTRPRLTVQYHVRPALVANRRHALRAAPRDLGSKRKRNDARKERGVA